MKMVQIVCQPVTENSAVDVAVSAVLEDTMEDSLKGEEKMEASESETPKPSFLRYRQSAESFARDA